MAGTKRGLGRGLGALFGEDTIEEVIAEEKAADRKKANGADRIVEKNSARTQKKNEKKSESEAGKVQNANLNQKAQESAKSVSMLDAKPEQEAPAQTELELKVSEIEPNRDQPRKAFDEAQLEELADSIQKYGVLQPLLVQKRGESYEIIAGERRWRAAKLAGLKTVPVVIREYSPQQAMEIALIENVQREDLNPIEEALAYQRLMQEFSLKQEEIAERVSKNRTTITNCMRLLNLAPEVQQMLIERRITSGHARALLAVTDPSQQIDLAKKVEQERMSVREVEKAVKLLGKEKKEKKKTPVDEELKETVIKVTDYTETNNARLLKRVRIIGITGVITILIAMVMDAGGLAVSPFWESVKRDLYAWTLGTLIANILYTTGWLKRISEKKDVSRKMRISGVVCAVIVIMSLILQAVL